MSLEQKDLYFVAVKLFLEREGKLFIFKDGFGAWDLPGGRIRKAEFEAPLEQVIRRKMAEELGDGIAYSVGAPAVLMRHKRIEAAPGNPESRIFAVGYPAVLEGGEPRLPSHHVEMEWVDLRTFEPEGYFTGGWLAGVQEYLALWRKNNA